jgi:hypothetical protein
VIEVVARSLNLERPVAGKPLELSTEDLPFDKSLSLPLIRGLVDEVAITPLEGGGASVLMVIGLDAG